MVALFNAEFLGADCGAGDNGPWYRVSFVSGMDKLTAYASDEVFKQVQGFPRLTQIMLGIDVQERRSGGWSGRVVEVKKK